MTKLQKLQEFLSIHTTHTWWNHKGYEGLDYLHQVGGMQNDWNQTLVTKINQISATIFKDTQLDIVNRGGGANVIIYSLSTKHIMDTLEYLHLDVTPIQGCYKIGTLAGRYTVFLVPALTKIKIRTYVSPEKYEEINYDEKKIFVCRLKDVNKSIFDLKNYIKVGVIEITEL